MILISSAVWWVECICSIQKFRVAASVTAVCVWIQAYRYDSVRMRSTGVLACVYILSNVRSLPPGFATFQRHEGKAFVNKSIGLATDLLLRPSYCFIRNGFASNGFTARSMLISVQNRHPVGVIALLGRYRGRNGNVCFVVCISFLRGCVFGKHVHV